MTMNEENVKAFAITESTNLLSQQRKAPIYKSRIKSLFPITHVCRETCDNPMFVNITLKFEKLENIKHLSNEPNHTYGFVSRIMRNNSDFNNQFK